MLNMLIIIIKAIKVGIISLILIFYFRNKIEATIREDKSYGEKIPHGTERY